MTGESRLRAAKIWQTDDFKLIWQVSPLYKGQLPAKKMYLILDISQNQFGVKLEIQKPEGTNAKGAVVNLLRKYARTCTLRDCFVDQQTQAIWVGVQVGPTERPAWYLQLTPSRPPELSLINVEEQKTYVRFGQKGTFTKAKTYEGINPKDIPDTQKSFLLEGLIDSHTETEDDLPEDNEVESTELDNRSAFQKTAYQRLKRRRKTLVKSLNKLEQNLSTDANVLDTEQKAKLLQSFAHLIKPESISIDLAASITGLDANITIELDPEYSAGQNIEAYFIKTKKLKKSVIHQASQLKALHKDLQDIETNLTMLKNENVSDAILTSCLKRFKLNTDAEKAKTSLKAQTPEAKPHKTYESSEEITIWVGKGSKENDQLTKQAKGNDFWIHAAGVTGSHVLVDGSMHRKIDLPAITFKEAAILALHHSKLRSDFSGEVYYTRRAKIKKSKGMPAGLWNVEHCETVFLRYTDEELKNILNRLKK